MIFNEKFKKESVKKMLTTSKTILQLSKEIGVSPNTLYNWKRKFSKQIEDYSDFKSPRNWRNKKKISAILEFYKLNENDQGVWLRKNGLKSEHISIWENELIDMNNSDNYKQEIKDLKKINAKLEKELARKEKALAEVSALLVLKKKADALFQGNEEN